MNRTIIHYVALSILNRTDSSIIHYVAINISTGLNPIICTRLLNDYITLSQRITEMFCKSADRNQFACYCFHHICFIILSVYKQKEKQDLTTQSAQ